MLPEAQRLAHGYAFVDLAHLVETDLADRGGVLRPVLDGRADDFRAALKAYCLERIPPAAASGTPPYGDDLAAIDDAFRTREPQPGHNIDAIVAALPLGMSVPWSSLLAAALAYRPHRLGALIGDFDLDPSSVLPRSVSVAEGGQASEGSLPDDRSVLEHYTINLSGLPDLDEVIGREAEIDRLVTILGRKEANNAILLGEAGVGKTKIVEGLALRVRKGDVHPRIRGKEILQLDLGLLVAGAQYLGQFQERLKSLMQALQAARGRYILFIDEIHQLLGLGRTSGAMDAANL